MVEHGDVSIMPLQARRRSSTKGAGSRPSSRGPRKVASRSQSLSRTSSRRQQQPQPKIERITPPLTPSTSTEDLTPCATTPIASHQFHDYLRAQYSFHPPYDPSSATITLPLNRGDILLVHTVHASGWADGTLLDSGMRGWLPTNYCGPYDPTGMRNLLNALTQLYEVIRDCTEGDLSVLYNQAYTRGMVAGVRVLLVCDSGLVRVPG
jgi:SH3 domain